MATTTNGIATGTEIYNSTMNGKPQYSPASMNTKGNQCPMYSEVNNLVVGSGKLNVSGSYGNTQCVKFSDISFSLTSLGVLDVTTSVTRNYSSETLLIGSVDFLNSIGNTIATASVSAGATAGSPAGTTGKYEAISYYQAISSLRFNINASSSYNIQLNGHSSLNPTSINDYGNNTHTVTLNLSSGIISINIYVFG